jgi:hypothetical protein
MAGSSRKMYQHKLSSIHYAARDKSRGGEPASGKPVADLKTCLELQVGKWGEINTEYGGFEIQVNDPSYFPWYDVFITLLKYGYEVWVTVKKDKLVILASVERD